jgi:hypothetical protein
MRTLVMFWRKARFLAAVGGCWLGLAAAAWAQAPNPGEPAASDGPSFAMPYGVVILGIALGLAFVLHASNRRDRAKPDGIGSAK